MFLFRTIALALTPLLISITFFVNQYIQTVKAAGTTTATSWQRKTWHDGDRYWRAYQDSADSRIEFEYSTNGTTWTENTSARISVNSTDFSLIADSSNVYISYTNGYDTEVRKSSSYPGTSFSWGSANIAYDGSSATDLYYYPVIILDTSNKIWVGATRNNSGTYTWNARRSTSASDVTAWGTATSLDSSSNSNKYGILIRRLSGSIYSAWIDNTSIEGKNYNGTTWDGSPVTIGTGVSGVTTSLSGISDSSGDLHLTYIKSGGQTAYRVYRTAWEREIYLDDNASNLYPGIALNSADNDLYTTWVRSDDIFYKKGDSITGSSLDFDGTADYVNIPYNANFDHTANLTIEFWFSPDVTIDSSIGSNKGIMSKANTNTDANNDWVFFWNSADAGQMRFGAYGDAIKTTTATWTAGEWYHIAVTVTSTNTAEIYVNGVLDTLGGDNNISSNPINGNQDTAFTPGLAQVASGDLYFDGKLDEIRIYDTPRTAAEIRSDMSSILTGTESNLTGYWNLSDGSGQTVSDLDSNNNDGTLGATSGSNSDDPTWSSTIPFIHSWDASATSWKTTGTNTYPTLNSEASGRIFAFWYDGTNLAWDRLLGGSTISIILSSDGTINYGSLALSGSKTTLDLSDTQTVVNDGEIVEDFDIKTSQATGGTAWSLGASIGSDIFKHEFSVNSGGAWTPFTTANAYQALATNVAINATQSLDFRLTAPSSSSDYVQKSITVTIMASQP